VLALALALAVGLWAGPASPEGPADREALLALDVKDGSAAAVLTALAEAAGLQAVVDPGVTCRLTLKVNGLPFPRAFAAVLSACGLGYEGEGQFVRVAPLARLRQEAADRRRLADAQRDARPRQEVRLRLSYARAAEIAPKLKGFLSPRGEVVFDERTNTLILMDHGQP
jgi:type IV pilus assembly protein PilQ